MVGGFQEEAGKKKISFTTTPTWPEVGKRGSRMESPEMFHAPSEPSRRERFVNYETGSRLGSWGFGRSSGGRGQEED